MAAVQSVAKAQTLIEVDHELYATPNCGADRLY